MSVRYRGCRLGTWGHKRVGGRVGIKYLLWGPGVVKSKSELGHLVELIHSDSSPVGMDAVYVHALILDKLQSIEQRLEGLERQEAQEPG
ncbi:MAG: hypothetical protein MK364_01960 [Pirellulales bacterium]|nr:hypothetical protein [Pirellulales bacterium]